MDHRVTVTICGNEYTFVAEEDGAYVEKVAAYVDQKMTEILSSTKAGHTDAAVLTAANIADELFKQYGVKVEKRRIDVANIRNAGDFTVSVWLYAGITAEMTAKVEIG